MALITQRTEELAQAVQQIGASVYEQPGAAPGPEETAEPAAPPDPSEAKAEATPPADPEPVEEAAPSETTPVDAP